MIDSIVFQRATSLDEALQLLSQPEPPPTVIAGGTDVMVWLHGSDWRPQRIVDISPIRPECTQIYQMNGIVSVGALCTHAEMAASDLLRRVLPVLAQAAGSIGAPPIRNRGTIGGNMGGSSPAGDILPVLLAYETMVVLRSAEAMREVPYSRFCTGYRQIERRPDELIVEVKLVIPPEGTFQRWYKVGGRLAQACSKVNMAAVGRLDEGGMVEMLRIGMGSCTAMPVLLHHVSQVVVGRQLTRDVVEEAGQALEQDISPIDDPRSTADYRMAVARNLVKRFLRELRGG